MFKIINGYFSKTTQRVSKYGKLGKLSRVYYRYYESIHDIELWNYGTENESSQWGTQRIWIFKVAWFEKTVTTEMFTEDLILIYTQSLYTATVFGYIVVFKGLFDKQQWIWLHLLLQLLLQ